MSANIQRQHKNKGFTLIEIMVVIAILGILAATAIIAFNSHRNKAYNSAALSNLRKIISLEEALFSQFEAYGGTRKNANKRARKAKGDAVGSGTEVYLVTRNNTKNNPQRLAFRLSENVKAVVALDTNSQSFVVTIKHTLGDRRYCYDSESGLIYFDNRFGAGTPLTRKRAIGAKPNQDDCANAGMTQL